MSHTATQVYGDQDKSAKDIEAPLNHETYSTTDGDDAKSSLPSNISEKSLSWQQVSPVLLLLEYVVLAILSFPSTFAVLGMAGGCIATLIIGLVTLYTSHILWQYCMKFPYTRDICDVAFNLAHGGKWGRIAWWASFVGLVLNNVFIMGLHSVAGSVALNTISAGATCTQVFAVVITVFMFAGSLVRDLKHMSALGLLASSTMFIALLLNIIFSGVQSHPPGYTGKPVTIRAWAPPGTTFVQGFSACLNILYTYVGQIMIPSFIADMRRPEDFPKALYVSMATELILFTLGGAIIYSQVGEEYVTSPAYGALLPNYSKTVAGFVLPTIIIIGCLYSLITARVVFFQIFKENSVHRRQHTVRGWSVWFAITLVLWIVAYVIGQAVPFFNDLLSLISSLFDSWYGFIFWGFAYFEIHRGRWFEGVGRTLESTLNAIIIIVGFGIFGVGTYVSIQSILNSYATGAIKQPFRCTNNGF